MKSLVSLWTVLAQELGVLCGVDASRDIATLSRRSEKEGDAFLRITLPTFGKAFYKALDEGRWSPSSQSMFRTASGLPVFLRGFLENIFTPDGKLMDNPCTESIGAVAQLVTVFGKIEGVCTPRRNAAAIAGYVQADEECYEWDMSNSHLLQELREVALRSVVPMLSEADWKVSQDDIVPKHGPGYTADRLLGNQKYDVGYWPAHLEARFPWSEWAIPNYRFSGVRADGLSPEGDDPERVLTPLSHVVPAKLTLVPKTMSTPRIIVMEPTALQYMQQGLLGVMVESIERSSSLIGFTEQGPNRLMARRASLSQDLVTLDLSEASDRVTFSQAASVLGCLPNLWEALTATRSRGVTLPDGNSRPVWKFASMGSAVCFPVEAVVFLSAILLAVRRHHRKVDPSFDLTWPFVRRLAGRVRVYGDDCIFPVSYHPEVVEVFTQLGWQINLNKTFAKGNFRESCGGDYWCGEDITPVRLRKPIPTTLRQVAEVQSFVAFRNQLYLAGNWRTAAFCDRILKGLFRGTFPIVEETSPALGRTSVSFQPKALGTDRYQRALTRAWVLKTVIPKNCSSETGALLKCLIATGYGDEHLERSGRPVDVSINRQWMPTA